MIWKSSESIMKQITEYIMRVKNSWRLKRDSRTGTKKYSVTHPHKNRFPIIVAFLLITLLGTFILNSNFNRQIVRIEGTGIKHESSFGTDIRINQILQNNVILRQNEVRFGGKWTESNGFFCAVGADASTWIEIVCEPTDTLEIEFITQEGSGYTTIYLDNEILATKDLYSQNSGKFTYVMPLTQPSRLRQLTITWLFFIEGLLLEVTLLHWLYKKIKFKLPKWQNIVLLFLQACVLFAAVEIVGGNLGDIEPMFAIFNILLYFSLILVLFVIFPAPFWVGCVVTVVFLGFSVINYYVTDFRGTPIMPVDFLTWQTAANVASQYDYYLTKNIGIALLLSFFGLSFSKHFSRRESWVLHERVCLIVLAMLMFVPVIKKADSASVDLWNLKNNVKQNGLSFNLLCNVCNMHLDKPHNYDVQKIESFLLEYEEEVSDFNPNIVVIMNEAFSDLSRICDTLDSDQYMPYFNKLQENTVKGTAVVSVFGGTTSNSEYEFLTGNTMYFMNNSVPYQQHIYQNTYSMANTLKGRGYQAVAVHPYTASGYNRPRVYSYFGFDDFVSIESFSDYELARKRFISDKDSYEKVIEIFEQIQQTPDPAFIFNVTMQNHGNYSSGNLKDNVIQVPGMEGKFPDVEEYLTQLKYSDDALPILIEYFAEVDEPTILLLFGDHQPKLDDMFYQEIFAGKDYLNPYQKKYEVPFLIWANYDIEEEQDIYTSLNYLSAILFDRAGISCTAYQNYLLDMYSTIPVISANGYLGQDGEWYKTAEDNEIADKLEEYWSLQYYHMLKES